MQHTHTGSTRAVARSRSRHAGLAGRPARPARLSMTQRRQQLINAARRVFAERGFSGATTRQIAAAAGVTEAVIFQHFPDKDTLYAAILEEKALKPQAEQWFAALSARRAACDDAGVIRTLFEGILSQHERDPYFLRLMVYSALEQHPLARQLHAPGSRLFDFLEAFIREGQQLGRFRTGPPAVLVRAVLALPIYYVLQRRLFKTPWPPVRRDELTSIGVQFTLAGLAATPGRQEIVQ